MVRLFICILLLGIGAAQYQLWLGRASWSRLSELRVILNTQREGNESLRRTNEALQAEFNSLANNQDAIEERARRELNMVKPNEILFRKKRHANPMQQHLCRTSTLRTLP